MTQAALIDAIAEETGITKKKADEVIRSIAKEVTRQMAAGKDVRLFGIGKMKIVYRKARTGRNNMTKGDDGNGVSVNIPARKAIKFRPQTALLNAVRG